MIFEYRELMMIYHKRRNAKNARFFSLCLQYAGIRDPNRPLRKEIQLLNYLIFEHSILKCQYLLLEIDICNTINCLISSKYHRLLCAMNNVY